MQERQDLSKIKITDNIMFTSVFSNLEIVKKFLELLLSINIKTIKVLQKEKAIDTIGKSRGVRFDVYLENDAAIYDIEIQTSNTYDLPKRTRYYHSSIDSDLLDKGEKSFNILKVSYVIFICTFNPFNVENINECIYKFEKICILENKVLKLNDKSYDIFINSKCDLSKVKNNDVKAFIELLNNGYHSETKSELTNMIENEMSRLKENEEWRKEYMTLQEYDERMIVYVDMAKKMIKEKCSDEFILKIVDLSEEQLERIRYDVEHGYES
ncbi:MAG: Rpn family recombination-promoting nuclease/putative transposase [Firmicutes bacterium]|nr:Rpn family recombination-promoting nuclease/putative transposase [Bacillota bacterium]